MRALLQSSTKMRFFFHIDIPMLRMTDKLSVRQKKLNYRQKLASKIEFVAN
jgi:hypothetical protein